MAYEKLLAELLAERGRSDVDPRHAEAYFRLAHGTLDSLSREDFANLLGGVIAAIDGDPKGAERLAESYGLRKPEPAMPEPAATGPRHPEITVRLVGTDGNAFSVLGVVRRAMKAAGLPQEEIDEFMDQAMSGNCDNLLATCMKWVNVE